MKVRDLLNRLKNLPGDYDVCVLAQTPDGGITAAKLFDSYNTPISVDETEPSMLLLTPEKKLSIGGDTICLI